jgi:hypothetical protein
MPAPDLPLTGNALLVGVTDAMVAFHQRYHHRAPVTAKTLLLGGVYTDVEKTMIELQRSLIVQETRSAFQNAMQHRLIESVEHLSGRDVMTFISNHHVGPDMEIALFILDSVACNRSWSHRDPDSKRRARTATETVAIPPIHARVR